MKKTGKKVSLLLAFCMVLSLGLGLGACTTGGTKKAADTVSKGEITPIKWLTTGDAGAKPLQESDRILDEINSRLGIKLEVQIVPENNVEKVNVAMASGDFPDVVTGSYGTSATQQWIDNKMIVPLNPYFASQTDLKAYCENQYAWTATEGDYYGVPFIVQFDKANALIAMRGDWLQTLNLSYPETLEEMTTVLTAFTKNDPDGNGQDDTYGLTLEKPDSSTGFEWVFAAHGRKYADYALDSDGKIIPWFEEENFVQGMTYIKELWDNGVIDPEIFLNDSTKKEEKFYQGRAGAMKAPLFRHVSRHEGNLQKVNPEAKLVFGLPPKGADGTFGLNPQGKRGMFTGVTAACKSPEKAASFLNLMLSQEGQSLVRLGIEGTHYTKDGDTITLNEEEREKDSFSPNGWAHAIAWGSFFWPLESDYLPETEVDRDRALESTKLATEAQMKNLIKQKTPLEIKQGSALDDIFIQHYSDILQGKVDVETGSQELSKAWRSQGGDELLVELNQVYAEMK